jgi:hypothetical protein
MTTTPSALHTVGGGAAIQRECDRGTGEGGHEEIESRSYREFAPRYMTTLPSANYVSTSPPPLPGPLHSANALVVSADKWHT